MPRQTHYNSLGLSPSATKADIHRAWVTTSLETHPFQLDDLNIPIEEKLARCEKYEDAIHAYRVLSDVDKRKRYDEALRTRPEEDNESSEENTTWVIERTLAASSSDVTIRSPEAWNTCYRTHRVKVAEPYKYIFNTKYHGANPRTLSANINVLWKDNAFHYEDSVWKLTITLDPSYAKVTCFSAQNAMLFDDRIDVLHFVLSELEFVRPPHDPEATKQALRVRIERGPWDVLRLREVENHLVAAKNGAFRLAVRIWTKKRHFLGEKPMEAINCRMDVGERFAFTTNFLQKMAVKARVSKRYDLGSAVEVDEAPWGH